MHTLHNPGSVPAPVSQYSLAVETTPPSRYLFISGQIPETVEGDTPSGFEDQCRLVWQHILAVLDAAAMNITHLVKVNIYLTHKDFVLANRQIRQEILGECRPALTVVIVETLQSKWLLEIDATAAAPVNPS